MELEKEEYLKLYEKMWQIRLAEKKLCQLVQEGLLHGTTHLSIGQEAVAVGAAKAVGPEDLMMSNHRGHGHTLAKGADLKSYFCELLGKADGLSRGLGGSMHMADVAHGNLGTNGIIGPSISIPTGMALALKKEGKGRVVLSFFGEGASQAGEFHEALNMASLWKLPVVYICENNFYGFSTPVEAASAEPEIYRRAVAYRMPGEDVDGNDCLAVYDAVSKAVARARTGQGPTLLEMRTYRWMGHSKSDRMGYRSREEEAAWKKRCPIARLERAMAQAGVEKADWENVRAKAEAQVEEAVEYAKNAAVLTLEEAQALVYA